eukprot:scaffold13354_cov181-Alexandrium_tamarense.AAC.17
MEGSTAVISGVDGNPGCGVGSVQGAEWKLTGRVDEKDANEIFVDFSSKGGPKDLVGTFLLACCLRSFVVCLFSSSDPSNLTPSPSYCQPYLGKWDENGIRWPDGNKWTRQ